MEFSAEQIQGSIHPFWLEKRGLTYEELQAKKAEFRAILQTILEKGILDPATDPALQEKQQNVYIAGGFFTPYYKASTDGLIHEAEFDRLKANSAADLYVTSIPMDYGKHELSQEESLASYFKPEFRRNVVAETRKSVPFFAHFDGPLVVSTSSGKQEWRVNVHFCYSSITTIFNAFSLEPCKIAYHLDNLIFGKWYREYSPDNLVPEGKKNIDAEFERKYRLFKGFGFCSTFDELRRTRPNLNLAPVNINFRSYA